MNYRSGYASAVESRQVGMDLAKIEWMLERKQIEISDREFLFLGEHTQERLQNGDPNQVPSILRHTLCVGGAGQKKNPSCTTLRQWCCPSPLLGAPMGT